MLTSTALTTSLNSLGLPQRKPPLAPGVPAPLPADWRVGLDLVQISQIAHSLLQFGDAFTQRLFTLGEIGSVTHAGAPGPAGLAARFAAKEAVIKALNLSEAGVNWRDIEVHQRPDGSCGLQFHHQVAAQAQALGLVQWQISLSHDGDYAAAIVIGRSAPSPLATHDPNDFATTHKEEHPCQKKN